MLRKVWNWLNRPSPYSIWESSFKKLQEEKSKNGKSPQYWNIWYTEVCPKYKSMTESHRKIGIGYDLLTSQILEDMDKSVNERIHF